MRRNKSQECHEQWAFRIVPGVWACLPALPQVVKKTLTVVRTSPEKPSRCANIFGPNMFLRSSHFTAFLAGFLALSSCHAQTDSIAASPDGQWWKGLFRPEGGTDMTPGDQPTSPTGLERAGVDSLHVLEISFLDSGSPLPSEKPQDAAWTWSLPDTLHVLDSLDKADPSPLQGWRIQIYFGNLQDARAVRAAFRKDHPQVACQLLPIAPNYAVTVGNYRDTWAAQRALRDGEIGRWNNPLVIQNPIDLPPLD